MRFLATTAGLCSVLLFSSCAGLAELASQLDKPTARVTGAGLQGLSFDSANLLFDVEIQNPYAAALPLLNVDLALASGSAEPFLLVDLGLERSIPAHGKTTVQIPAQVAFLELASALSGVRPGSIVPYTADIGLALDVPGVGRQRLPLSTSGEFPIPTLPKVGVAGIEWTELSLTRAAAVLELEIENGNAFGIDVEGLDFALALAGRNVFESGITSKLELGEGAAQTLRIPFSMSAIQVAQAGFALLEGEEATYGLTGDMRLGTRFGPLASSFDRSGRAPLRR